MLIVHWADGGDGYSREYANNAACAVAAQTILRDYAQRGMINARAQIESKTEMSAEPRPIAVCIPT